MYDSNDDCGWLIEVDQNHLVQFYFIDFDLEHQSNCSYDYVALYDGADETAPPIVAHCGQNLPTPNLFTSTSNKMYVRFKADGSQSAKGFSANYTWV